MSWFTLCSSVPVYAQVTTVTWADPVKLSSDEEIFSAAVAADPYGGVHVFWAQDSTSGGSPDMIMVSKWDGSSWSLPNDVFAAPEGSGLIYDTPRATSDKSGHIYLVWSAGGTVYFSTAPAGMTTNAQAWTKPVAVLNVNLALSPQIVVDSSGTIHVVAADRTPGANILYVQSTDSGMAWTDAVPVSLIEPSAKRVPDGPQLLVDHEGILHVFWTEAYPPEYLGREIYHARSLDGGVTWSLPVRLSFTETQDDWDTTPIAAVDSMDELHLTWVCGKVNRCYRWSQDHGATWSEAQMVFFPLLGSGGWDAMTTDDYGAVYWLGTMREPAAVYSAVFSEDHWQQPPQPAISAERWGPLGEAHRPNAVVGLGNQLHAVVVEGDAGPVWYLSGVTTGAAVAPLTMPTAAPIKSTTAPITASETVSNFLVVPAGSALDRSNTRGPAPNSYPKEPPAAAPLDPTFISGVAVLLTVAAVFVVVLRRRTA